MPALNFRAAWKCCPTVKIYTGYLRSSGCNFLANPQSQASCPLFDKTSQDQDFSYYHTFLFQCGNKICIVENNQLYQWQY